MEIMMSAGSTDYKYIMQDISHVYLGAKYTYEELIEDGRIPFKIKSLVNRYIKPELAGEDLSLDSHFYYMTGQGFAYQTFLQLKTKVKISILEEKKGLMNKGKREYATRTLALKDFVKMPPEEKEEKGVLIQEIAFSKLALAATV